MLASIRFRGEAPRTPEDFFEVEQEIDAGARVRKVLVASPGALDELELVRRVLLRARPRARQPALELGAARRRRRPLAARRTIVAFE